MIKNNLLENKYKKDCQFGINCYILIYIKLDCYNTDLHRIRRMQDGLLQM